jgi:hypothetical protein
LQLKRNNVGRTSGRGCEMIRRMLGACLAVSIVLPVAGCSLTNRPVAQPSPQPSAQPPETAQQAITRLLGPDAQVSTVDTRTIAGRPGMSFLAVRTETTPTASAVMGVLVAVSEQYGGPGREIVLQVALPENRPADRFCLILKWNPTGAPIPVVGASSSYAPHSLLLDTGRGSTSLGTDIVSLVSQDVVLSSDVTTAAIAQAANGQGVLFERLREAASLP